MVSVSRFHAAVRAPGLRKRGRNVFEYKQELMAARTTQIQESLRGKRVSPARRAGVSALLPFHLRARGPRLLVAVLAVCYLIRPAT
jgi:hypothetical protein